MSKAKPYVLHFCKNKACNNGWLGPDEYGVKTLPPRHLYCLDCELFSGKVNRKDPKRVAAGRALAVSRAIERDLDDLFGE